MSVRVLHVVESSSPEAGSLAASLRGLFPALGAHEIESDAIGGDRLPGALDGLASHAGFDPNTIGQQVRRADVVHIHGWGTVAARGAAAAARKAKTPYLISPVGGLLEGPFRRKTWRDKLRGLLGENGLVRGAALVAAVNERERSALRESGLQEVRTLPYGLAFGDYSDLPTTDLPAVPDGPCLLLLGPIDPVEGLVPFMKAFAEVGDLADGWNLILAGPETGSWRKMLEAAVRRKGGADRVKFVPAPDVPSQRGWLARASVVAAPALHYRPATSTVQALAAGVAVLASDRVVPDGLDGAVDVFAPTREAMRAALRDVLQSLDSQRTERVGKAREAARSLLDWSVLVERYAQLYRELAR